MVAAGEAVHFFGVIPFRLVSYTSSVIPIILVILVQAVVEKWLDRIIPKSVNLVFVPMFTFLIMGTASLSVLGPIGSYVGEGLGVVFNWLSTNASWAPAVLIGGLLPIMVMFGLHHGVAPLGSMQMASLGYDSIFGPGCVCSNIAQGAAALVVALRTKDSKTKQTGYSSGVTAVLLYIGDDTMTYFYNIIIALLISAAATAVVTFLLSLKFEKAEPAAETKSEPVPAFEVPANTVAAPVEGTVVPMEEIPDETFSAGVLSQGLGIRPVNGEVVAPFSGTVTQVADTGHAIGLASQDGLELLSHVGVDTVEMNGRGFTPRSRRAIRSGPGSFS